MGHADATDELPKGGTLEGAADEGFGPVVDAFRGNFRDRGEVGAAVCVYVDGKPVVDMWGGLADIRSVRAWTATTPAVVFSVTKGVLAVCVYLLVQEGRLDLDAPVVRSWPTFGASGKDRILVRDLLTHRAGLPALDRSLSREEALAWDPVIEAIEAQQPLWPPGRGHAYHTLTYGWLVGEVIRRTSGVRVGAFIRERIARPLGLRFWVGSPPEERETVAFLLAPLPDTDAELAEAIRVAADSPVVRGAATLGDAWAFPAEGDHVTFNDPDIQAAEVPGANGIGDARSLARLYGACVGRVDGVRLMTPASVDDALVVRSEGPQVNGLPDLGERWGTGFALSSPPHSPLLGPRSFGHGGAGGELAFADDEYGIGFAYVNNQMGGVPDGRASALVEALRTCLSSSRR